MPKIMLIEDDLTMQSLLKTILELENFTVIDCDKRTLDEIVSTIFSQKPDLILMDVHYHKINGMDVLKKIRSEVSGEKIKVLMSSGMAIGEQCVNSGADGFLMKPYMPDELIEKIKALIKK